MKAIFTQALVFLPLLAGCGQNVMNMKRSLEHRPPREKASKDCVNGALDVFTLFYNYQKSGDMLETQVVQLGTAGCAVQVTVKDSGKVLDMLDLVRGTSKSYSWFKNKETGAVVNIWVTQKPKEFKGSDGKIVDTSPELKDCTRAKKELQEIFDKASIRVVEDRKGTPKRKCYVDAMFLDAGHSENFANYMKHSFPRGNKEPFNWYLDETTNPKVVSIHAVDAYQK
jgi:hypothetical protein